MFKKLIAKLCMKLIQILKEYYETIMHHYNIMLPNYRENP